MRAFLAIILLVGFLGVSGAYGEEAGGGGITFTIGFESFPGKVYYELESRSYKKGRADDYKTNPQEDDMGFSGLSLRLAKMTPIGFHNFYAGIEVGMLLATSGYERSWNLPAMTPGFTGKVSFPGFC